MLEESSSSVRIFYPKFDRMRLIEELEKKLEDAKRKLPLSLVVLFGSYAQGNHTVASDVDFLVVYKGEKREDAFGTVKKTLDVPLLEPHVYTRMITNVCAESSAGWYEMESFFIPVRKSSGEKLSCRDWKPLLGSQLGDVPD